ncbi:hypothetical protein AALO_G00262050 [Alosa alosa]|uniref:Uncharacterized protein n=1 Tax=Alosa alosa TaxID=278164 RepID=A0AAV6FVD0_9TELE|nr:hypothetical protein AALO_G00262050 [Alosa alosa]
MEDGTVKLVTARSYDSCVLGTKPYGTNGSFSFLYRWPHYSLKIPPKKRRRFSKTFWPLSHGSILSVQVYKRYPEGLGEVLYREQFDFNAEPPWDPS